MGSYAPISGCSLCAVAEGEGSPQDVGRPHVMHTNTRAPCQCPLRPLRRYRAFSASRTRRESVVPSARASAWAASNDGFLSCRSTNPT